MKTLFLKVLLASCLMMGTMGATSSAMAWNGYGGFGFGFGSGFGCCNTCNVGCDTCSTCNSCGCDTCGGCY